MGIPMYLAMTAAEFARCTALPEKIGWMACHFSPYGTGLSNLPDKLLKDSLLIVNDRTPICGHDPELIFSQLSAVIKEHSVAAVLLDFQRPDISETQALAKHLIGLPCPVGVSHLYAREINCPVFVPPVPVNRRIEEYLAPWQGREIWLEAALGSMTVRLDAHGNETDEYAIGNEVPLPFSDADLYCHYRIETGADTALFHLQRSKEDLVLLLEDSAQYGVTTAVGLYQELK